MEQGKVKAALRYHTSGGVLKLEDMVPANGGLEMRTTHDILIDKHPIGQPPAPQSLISFIPDPTDPINFDSSNADAIHHAALRMQGSGGPSGLDAFAWRRFCSSFGQASHDLCSALAAVGRRICSSLVSTESIGAFVACRLIPLNKCPGVRPIGVGEVPRRIIAKAVLALVEKFHLQKVYTTQGDPLAMAMYALATLPIIHQLYGTVFPQYSKSGMQMKLPVQAHVQTSEHGGTNYSNSAQYLTTTLTILRHIWLSKKSMKRKPRHYLQTQMATIHSKCHLGAALGSRSFTEE